MDIIGIIAEYNPFHNGHLYHLKKIKELYPNSLIILVLNGYFLERGEVSILTKEAKTKIALNNNIDIVIELPFAFGTQSADRFADAAITLLNNLHVQKIIFGSESNDIKTITQIAKKQLDESYDEDVKKYLSEGLNYPTALAKSLNIDFEFLPNDLLGISYIKAILKHNYSIEAITIKRTNDYHDTKSNEKIISASNIRNKLKQNISINDYLPPISLNNITCYNEELLFLLLKSKIITDKSLDKYLDVDEGIEYRLKEMILKSKTLEEYIQNIKTKRYTYNKIKRMLIHILIGLEKSLDYNLDYIKILGFNTNGQSYLNSIKDDLKIPLNINKDSIIYKYELKAALIYDLICNTNTSKFELSAKPIIIKNKKEA